MITVPTILIVTFLYFYCLFVCLFSFVLFLIKLLFFYHAALSSTVPLRSKEKRCNEITITQCDNT